MKMNMYAIYDVKGDNFNVPFFAPAHGVALRNFADLANDRSTVVGRHPGDFKICYLADFDDATGVATPVALTSLGFGTDFVKKDAHG